MTKTDPRLLRLSSVDNILVLTQSVAAGETLLVNGQTITMTATLGMGHKLASCDIAEGTDVLKYGAPIGFASTAIKPGDHVHVHNLTSRYTTVEIPE